MSFKAKVYGRTDGRRTDGRRTKSDHKSSPCHFVTGELKMENKCFIIADHNIKVMKYTIMNRVLFDGKLKQKDKELF
jgi:hypothetical protein